MKKGDLAAISREVSACTLCRLSVGRTNAVPGEGPPNASLMLLGEAPGRMEDKSGRPFVGQAGRLLEKALAQAGLRREDVFITSVVKCRPPENREPKDDEAASCRGYLERQIAAVRPAVVVLLGRVAYVRMTGRKGRIERGPAGEFKGSLLFATYHPAAALHGRPSLLGLLADDLREASSLASERRLFSES
jgi:uracil-DNA glycosylase family 4